MSYGTVINLKKKVVQYGHVYSISRYIKFLVTGLIRNCGSGPFYGSPKEYPNMARRRLNIPICVIYLKYTVLCQCLSDCKYFFKNFLRDTTCRSVRQITGQIVCGTSIADESGSSAVSAPVASPVDFAKVNERESTESFWQGYKNVP